MPPIKQEVEYLLYCLEIGQGWEDDKRIPMAAGLPFPDLMLLGKQLLKDDLSLQAFAIVEHQNAVITNRMSLYVDGAMFSDINTHLQDQDCPKHKVPYREQYGRSGHEIVYGICDDCLNEV